MLFAGDKRSAYPHLIGVYDAFLHKLTDSRLVNEIGKNAVLLKVVAVTQPSAILSCSSTFSGRRPCWPTRRCQAPFL